MLAAKATIRLPAKGFELYPGTKEMMTIRATGLAKRAETLNLWETSKQDN